MSGSGGPDYALLYQSRAVHVVRVVLEGHAAQHRAPVPPRELGGADIIDAEVAETGAEDALSATIDPGPTQSHPDTDQEDEDGWSNL